MKGWNKVPFGDLLIDSKDGEWGDGAPGVGFVAADMIRGTDFAELNNHRSLSLVVTSMRGMQ